MKYENYAQHINGKILPRRDEWSLLFRIESQLPTNNINTSSIASNTLTSRLINQYSRFLNRGTVAIDIDKIRREADGTFTVPSETKKNVEYTVNMELRICSCMDGLLIGPCKHLKIVATSRNLAYFDIIPETNPEMRKIWMELGTGKKTSIPYLLPLSNPNQTSEERTFEEDIEMRTGLMM